MEKEKLNYIKLAAENGAKNDTHKWKIITKETLLEIYGGTLGNYSATGKRGKRPPIHHGLFKGLFNLAKEITKGEVEKGKFVNFINKIAYNKRKYRNRKASSQTSKTNKKLSKIFMIFRILYFSKN